MVDFFYIIFPELLGGLKDFAWLTNDQVLRRVHPFMLRREKKGCSEGNADKDGIYRTCSIDRSTEANLHFVFIEIKTSKI